MLLKATMWRNTGETDFVKKSGRGKEQGTRNKEQGTGNREQGTRNREQGTRNMEQGTNRSVEMIPTFTNYLLWQCDERRMGFKN